MCVRPPLPPPHTFDTSFRFPINDFLVSHYTSAHNPSETAPPPPPSHTHTHTHTPPTPRFLLACCMYMYL